MNNNSRIAKNSILLALRMVIVTFISIFTTRYLLKNLGVVDYGIYNVTLSIVALFTFLSPSLTNAIQRFYNYELGKNGEESATRVFVSGLIIQIVIALIIILICETVGLWYVQNKLVVPENRQIATLTVFHISVVAVVLSMLQTPFVASIMAHERMSFYATVNIFDAIFKLIVAIGLKYSYFDNLVIYGYLLLLIHVLDFSAYSLYSFISFQEVKIKFSFHKQIVIAMMSFTGWNLLETFARIIKDNGCNLLFNTFFGAVLNAARGVANQVSYAFTSIVDSTVMASRPRLVQSYAKEDYDTSIKIFYILSKGVLFIIYIIALPVFLEIDFILKLWLGGAIPDYAPIFIRLSIILILIDKLASPVTALIHATGSIKQYHICSCILNVIVLPFSWLVLNWGFGAPFVYIITIIFAVVAQYLYLILLRRQISIPISTYFNKVVIPFVRIIPSSSIPLAMYFCLDEEFVRIVFIIISSIFLGLTCIYYFGLDRYERIVIVNVVNNIIHSNKNVV